MKKFFFIIAIAMYADGSMPPIYFWSLKSAHLYFLDWGKKGYPESKKKELVKTPPIKVYLAGAPKELSYRETPFIDSGPRVKEFQLAILFIYEKEPKEISKDYLFVDRNCGAVELRGRQVDPKVWITSIYGSVPKNIRSRIFQSKSCKEMVGSKK